MTDTPTVRKRRVGRILRELRERAGLSHTDVAGRIESSSAVISRIESGQNKIMPRHVHDLLDIYGAPDHLRDQVLDLIKEAERPRYWQPFERHLPKVQRTYLSLESEASLLCGIDTHAFHPLLQTTDYARAVLAADWRVGTDDARRDQLLALGVARQDLIGRAEDPLGVSLFLDESVLRRPIGGVDVLREQLHHVQALVESPHIDVRVVPNKVGLHPGVDGPFTLLHFDEPDMEVGYVPHRDGCLYLQRSRELDELGRRLASLAALAFPASATAGFIGYLLGEIG
ncbi:helix-turn-helix domain-containing protein [Allokutzneria sp. A3M-2-11 16]|uniref:helix-turn-helix domain-containing protein n=1 Tax=Allokutzneria sp. A3M-2-11 16 TaxID=2962043 RepID=UPI0020B7E2FA|nr:helix-turn-helix transcriptional regulator [Allokutzneria sp. A3M-2-11 16]MCP3799657.1 helix-turn-helix domain-containing protein [Allokutzneria sp. A3M-2-11 16]